MTQYWIGICFGLAGTFCSALAMSLQVGGVRILRRPQRYTYFFLPLQKLAQRHHQAEPVASHDSGVARSYYSRWRFIAGIACMIVGAVMNIFQLSFLTQTESASMAAVTLVWNCLLARACLGEVFSPTQLVGNGVVGFGTVLAVALKATGPQHHEALGVAGVEAALTRPAALAGGIIVGLALACAVICIHVFDGQSPEEGHRGQIFCLLRTAAAGLFQGCTGVAVKCLIEMVKGAPGISALYSPWVLLAALVVPCGVAGQIACLNSALRRYDAMLVVPAFQGTMLVTGVAFGQVFLADGGRATASEALGLWGGVAATLAGVAVIFLGARSNRDEAGVEKDASETELQPLTLASPLPADV